jgi:transposase
MERTPLELQLMQENAALRAEFAAYKAAAEERIEKLLAQVDELRHLVFGRKSEKMGKVPPLAREMRDGDDGKPKPKKTPDRNKNQDHPRKKTPPRSVHRTVADTVSVQEQECPHCHQAADKPMGAGKESLVLEYLEAAFDLIRYVRETCVCPCGKHVVTATAADKPFDKCQYGPGLISHLIVTKCQDGIPLNRLKSIWAREGADISVNTMYDLFHHASELLEPLNTRIGELVSQADLVQADETPLTIAKHDGKPHRGFTWVFLTDELAYYKFSPSRSGQTPLEILGGTQGTLVVDGYSGYNRVTLPDGRDRSGCWAHARRKFYKALPAAGDTAKAAILLIRKLFRVEHDALEQGIVRTEAHLQMRQDRSAKILDELLAWLRENEDMIPPKSVLGEAISYTLNQWPELTLFLTDARIPMHNNASERALRKVALGRKNWLFVGNSDAGDHYATLMTLVTSCVLNDINPEAYLKDVLIRITTHPMSRIDELLPHQWKPPATEPSEIPAI